MMQKLWTNSETRYLNPVKLLVDLVKPQNLVLIAGRGTAKTTDIIAERAIDVCYDMPRSPLAFISDTYVNLLTNIVPAVILGWEERKKWKEGYHFVVDKAPPDHWPKPFIKTFNYKHTISTFLGNKFFLISLDRPSISAGISVVHHFMDETKYHPESKVSKLMPTLRGDAMLYSQSHYFMGQTICTDMPNPAVGEHDWMLRLEKNMNRRQIKMILQTAMEVNRLQIELMDSRGDKQKEQEITQELNEWLVRLRRARQGSTLFHTVSSYANADILTAAYFEKLYKSLDYEEFKVSVLSLRGTLSRGERFYGKLGPQHFYTDGYDYEYYDQYGIRDNVSLTSRGLRYCDPTKPLEGGLDMGNMISLVIGQDQGKVYRVLKNMYVIPDQWIREIADKFLSYFAPHQNKVIKLWYDRAANAYQAQKEDFATKVKYCIEHRDYHGKSEPTGWKVILMSRNQKNITHQEEYDLMNELMGGGNPHLPKLQIDQYECKELKSSLELAPVVKDPRSGMLKKDKRSEKLPHARLPMESTNMSDAFKYLLCRESLLRLVKKRTRGLLGDPNVY